MNPVEIATGVYWAAASRFRAGQASQRDVEDLRCLAVDTNLPLQLWNRAFADFLQADGSDVPDYTEISYD